METLAYLHLALAYETLADVGLGEEINWRKLSNQAGMYWLPVIVALGVLGMASETLAQTLQQGDSGPQVTIIQERLQQLGYFQQSPTGNFGSITRDAVIRFQQEHGLEPDGIVGTQTEAALFSSPRQVRLRRLNPPAITPQPDSQMVSTPKDSDVLQRGDNGLQVSRLQERLRDLGFYSSSITGLFDSRTQEAVQGFQRENSLFPNGVADSATLVALELISVPQPNRYVVVVPVGNENTLDAVRAVPGFEKANLASVGRGSYVNAGSFPNRASAESRSYLLRSQGFDARVAYWR